MTCCVLHSLNWLAYRPGQLTCLPVQRLATRPAGVCQQQGHRHESRHAPWRCAGRAGTIRRGSPQSPGAARKRSGQAGATSWPLPPSSPAAAKACLSRPRCLFHRHLCCAGCHNNLWSNIDLGRGNRAFFSSGQMSQGAHSGAPEPPSPLLVLPLLRLGSLLPCCGWLLLLLPPLYCCSLSLRCCSTGAPCACVRRTLHHSPTHPSPPHPPCSGQQHVVGDPCEQAARQVRPAANPEVRLWPAAQLCGHDLQRPRRRQQRHLSARLAAALPPVPGLVHPDHSVARGAAAAGCHPASNGPIHCHAAHSPRAPGPARDAVAARDGGGSPTAGSRMPRARLAAAAQRLTGGLVKEAAASRTIFYQTLDHYPLFSQSKPTAEEPLSPSLLNCT